MTVSGIETRRADGNDPSGSRKAAYERVCESYHAVDDFRTKLLGFLPVATGTGVFLLLSGKSDLIGTDTSRVRHSLGAIGAFGFLFTFGLFAYELFGIKKCHYLIEAGKHLEAELEVEGQFTSRPRSLANLINEPFASAVIYPACLAAWVFVALVFVDEDLATWLALGAVAGGFVATLLGASSIAANQLRESRIIKLVREKKVITRKALVETLLCEDAMGPSPPRTPVWVRRSAIRMTIRRLVRTGSVTDRDSSLGLPAPP
jgi:hypothetical protein